MTRWIVFSGLIVPIWGLLHWYVGKRLLDHARAPKWLARPVWALLIFHACISPLAMIVQRLKLDATWQEPLVWFSYIGMGVFCWFAILVLARDLPYGLYLLSQRLFKGRQQRPAPSPAVGQESPKLSRRQLFVSTTSAGIAVAGVGGSLKGYYNATKLPDIKQVSVPIKGLPKELKGLRIVQLSDIHLGNTIAPEFLAAVVEKVNTLDADIVAITGDIVDGYVEQLFEGVAVIDQLKSKLGVYYVTGNHEYYWDGPAWIKAIDGLPNVKALVNSHEVVIHKGHKLVIGGVTDYSAARMIPEHASSPKKAMEGAPKDAAFKLLLAHQPKSIYEASVASFDLQLSGHTHGGQFYPWNFVVGMVHPFSKGLGDYEQMKIYVSCGTGYWGPPMRLGTSSEITVLELEPA